MRSKATIDKAFADYPKGTIFRSATGSGRQFVSTGKFVFTENGSVLNYDARYGMAYNHLTNKWAEIITDKIIIPSERDLLVKVLHAFNRWTVKGPVSGYMQSTIDEIRQHLQSDHH